MAVRRFSDEAVSGCIRTVVSFVDDSVHRPRVHLDGKDPTRQELNLSDAAMGIFQRLRPGLRRRADTVGLLADTSVRASPWRQWFRSILTRFNGRGPVFISLVATLSVRSASAKQALSPARRVLLQLAATGDGERAARYRLLGMWFARGCSTDMHGG